jgi:arylsulfatase A-like enzyme
LQHGEAEHGGIWDEQLRVPLILHLPGQQAARLDKPVALVDVIPILMGWVDLPGKAAFLAQAAGRDALYKGNEETWIVSQESGAPWQTSFGRAPRLALTGQRWKLIHDPGGRDQLYDLVSDPHELHDLATDEQAKVSELRSILRAQLERQEARRVTFLGEDKASEPELDPALREELESLGYL